MCGIVGYVGNKQVVPLIIEGLRKLEYRGYDSAGIAVVNESHDLSIRRAEGKLRNLEEAIRLSPLDGTYGIGHTRWATHGRPTEENAHPHRDCTGRVVVVHNGIIENYLQLKERLRQSDHQFVTETDTEIVAHLIEEYLKHGDSFEKAVRAATRELRGIFALSIINADEADTVIAVRQGPPVVIGLGDREYFVASDIPPILQHTRDVFFLGDGEIAILTKDAVRVTDFDGDSVQPAIQRITWDPIMAEKGGFKHFMLKEIYEQPRAVRDTVQGRISLDSGRVFLDEMQNITEGDFKRLQLDQDRRLRDFVACGPGRQIHDRTTRARTGRRRLCIGVSLSRSGNGRAHSVAGYFAVRRDCGHNRGLARSKRAGIKGSGNLQCAGFNDRPRSRWHHPDTCGSGNRRSIYQSIHVADDCLVSAGTLSR